MSTIPELATVASPMPLKLESLENSFKEYRVNEKILNKLPDLDSNKDYYAKLQAYINRNDIGEDLTTNESFRSVAKTLLGLKEQTQGIENFPQFFEDIKEGSLAGAQYQLPTDMNFSQGSVYDVMSHLTRLFRLTKDPIEPGDASASFHGFYNGVTSLGKEKLISYKNGIITYGKYETIKLLESITKLQQKLSLFKKTSSKLKQVYLDAMYIPAESQELIEKHTRALIKDIQAWLDPIKAAVRKFISDNEVFEETKAVVDVVKADGFHDPYTEGFYQRINFYNAGLGGQSKLLNKAFEKQTRTADKVLKIALTPTKNLNVDTARVMSSVSGYLKREFEKN